MNDEEFAASQVKKKGLQHLAKNPTDNMTVFRMQTGPGDSLGVHWTTDENVAHYTGLGGREEDRQVHRGVVDRSQVITQGEWMGGNIRSHHTDRNGEFQTGKSQWGLDMEAEVRLRPGSTVREHAVAPQGTHEYAPTGREPTVEARGHHDYVDLAHHAVQGTAEAERLHMKQQALPHIQQAMFDPVVNNATDETIGYTPKWDLIRGGKSLSEAIDFSTNDVERIGKSAGLGEWEAGTNRAHEPLLSQLRPDTPVSQPQRTHHNVNQQQFEL
jgi:hypothetical protein